MTEDDLTAPATFDRYVEAAWRRYLVTLDPPECDDVRGLARLKSAYWAGAETFRAALQAINGAPINQIEKRAMRARLEKGLQAFGATLQPLRRLDS